MLRLAVINYLYYNKNYSVSEAEELFFVNEPQFKKVAEIIGEDFLMGLLKSINKRGRGNKTTPKIK